MSSNRPLVSVCSPVHNEADNLEALVSEMDQALTPHFGQRWEQVLVDDGSSDDSARIVERLAQDHHGLRLVRHAVNQGERAAWRTAFAHARGDVVVMLAADLQNDPRDIPGLVQCVLEEGYDCCTGFRTRRKDGPFYWCATRVLNTFSRVVFDVAVQDVSSSFFAVRRELVAALPLVKNDHRYVLPLFRRQGARIKEMPTAHRPRQAGASHYSKWKVLWAVPEVAAFTGRLFTGYYDSPNK